MNKQEKILQHILNNTGLGMQYSNYELISAIKDCFTIQRLEKELERIPPIFRDPNNKIRVELTALLKRYENIL